MSALGVLAIGHLELFFTRSDVNQPAKVVGAIRCATRVHGGAEDWVIDLAFWTFGRVSAAALIAVECELDLGTATRRH